MSELLKYETINPKNKIKSIVIWLHGLGSNGHDFVPIVPELKLPDELGIKFIFPHAPAQAVTLNMGMHMPAWYDIFALHRDARQDEKGVLRAVEHVKNIIEHERQAHHVAYENIIIAGFSQGGAVALATALTFHERLAGILALSTYLPIAEKLLANPSQANQKTPIMMMHGSQDMVVTYDIAQLSLRYLQQHHYAVEWREYPMAHEVCLPEIQDISRWVRGVLK